MFFGKLQLYFDFCSIDIHSGIRNKILQNSAIRFYEILMENMSTQTFIVV